MKIKMEKWKIISLLLTVTLLVIGLCHCFLSGILMMFYHMDSLHFLSGQWFYIFPMWTLSLGLVLLGVSILGISATVLKSRVGLLVYAGLIALIVVPQVLNIYFAGKLSSIIHSRSITEAGLDEADDHIKEAMRTGDTAAMNRFFRMQRDFGCCGLFGDTGFKYWDGPSAQYPNNIFLKQFELPQTCCVCGEDCGCQVDDYLRSAREFDSSLRPIHRVGCLSIIDTVYRRELEVILDIGYMIFALISTVLEVSSVAVAFLYANRLRKLERSADK